MPDSQEVQRKKSPSPPGQQIPASPRASSPAPQPPQPTSLPSISLPKGGGAIRGIGEKFAANPVTGTASFSIPIFTSAGRSGFSPQLALSYDSGAGNGPFGLGWHLSAPAITRKTDKGLPRYQDADDSDTFIMWGAEDLVPALLSNAKRDAFPETLNGIPFAVRRYRPRVEAAFARIEHWINGQTGRSHWRVTTRENITSIYGLSPNPDPTGIDSLKYQIVDPDYPEHVFSWLLSISFDDIGNLILYEYKGEDQQNVPLELHEQNHSVSANRYLKRIKYGFETPYYPDGLSSQPRPIPADWHFQVVFDYGDHDLLKPGVDDDVVTPWPCRPDAFSSYRAGFELRTYRLCRRVLMFHDFVELAPPSSACLVRSTDVTFDENPLASFLVSVSQTGYLRDAHGDYTLADPQTGKVLSPLSMPPLEFSYSQPQVDPMLHFVDADSLENLPAGPAGTHTQWVDLDGEGLPGLLTEQPQAWYYKRNLSALPSENSDNAARFEAQELVALKPSLADPGAGQQLMDLARDGQLYLVQYNSAVPGYYERAQDGQWQPFTAFPFNPNINWNDPNLRSIDLNGDGYADILISEEEVFTWYPGLATDGFGAAETVRKALDEEKGPCLAFEDAKQSIYLADLSGDGLTDIVRIRNGEVCYWPNLGFGHFGAKISMDDSPVFDRPDQFDQKRIRLADIDGSGTTDLLYLGHDQVTFWFNQSGNRWSAAQHIASFPATDNLAAVSVVDLLGNGTACLVWSTPLPGSALQPMGYIDLMGGQKPYLLVGMKNNLGEETRLQYSASTKFYLQDRAAGSPWITRLPFPVQVVERVETFDYVSGTKLVSLYKYHHGYFDGPEREFRGFGMVEQFDTEAYSKFSGTGLFSQTPLTDGEEFHLPAVHTKTWFHTGGYVGRDKVLGQYAQEYYAGDPLAWKLPDPGLPVGLSPQEAREAARALKGQLLRQEICADDGTQHSLDPYQVSEHSYRILSLQPLGDNPHAVFYSYVSEILTSQYERDPKDPRLGQALTLQIDSYGNVTKSVSIGYHRRDPAPGKPVLPPEQKQTLITYTENEFTNPIDTLAAYRTPLACETRTYELKGFTPGADGLFSSADFVSVQNDGDVLLVYDQEIPYESQFISGRVRRMIERTRTRFLKDDLSGPLPFQQLQPLALTYESYQMAFTPGLLANTYGARLSPSDLQALLEGDGSYLDLDGDGARWIPSGRSFFSPDPANPDSVFARAHFYLPQASRDPFGNLTQVSYDVHDLMAFQVQDALGNIVQAANDYRVLTPWLVTDPNGNQSAVRFDALGLVVANAVMGKPNQNEGDTLDDPTSRVEYALFNWRDHGRPNYAHTFARELHGPANPRWQESYSYSDGSGREIMKKAQAEPGLAPVRDAAGQLIHDGQGKLVDQFTNTRWVGSGRTVFDNKGNPVKQYEPFFAGLSDYENEKELVETGVTPLLRYDPLARLIRTDLPDGTFTQVEFDPWVESSSDANDTVLESRWYLERGSPDPAGPEPGNAESRAAWLAAKHAHTPTLTHFDSLGRTFLTIADNGPSRQYETRRELDIEDNERSLTDALGRKVMTYAYDMLGHKIQQVSRDAGERWMFNNVAGKPVRAWDTPTNPGQPGHAFSMEYDALRRLIRSYVLGADIQDPGRRILFERVIYGESHPASQGLNLRGKVFMQLDGAGVLTHTGKNALSNQDEAYDFKGNLLHASRQLISDYKRDVDWTTIEPLLSTLSPALLDLTSIAKALASVLDADIFLTSTTFDALNRQISLTTPDSSRIIPTYNEANLVEKVDVFPLDAASSTAFVTNLDYDAKGQRELIEYGNGVRTEYEYDPQTFRLSHLTTLRGGSFAADCPTPDAGPCGVQNLHYTYDPVGNIIAIRDDAQQTIFFNNQVVSPSSRYTYDALYRLIGAAGREHIGQNALPAVDDDDGPRMNQSQPTDSQAMRTFSEAYGYDAVGNIFSMIHTAQNGNWTRNYAYDEPNLNPANNRLTSTVVGNIVQTYTYDTHGSMLQMPHLAVMQWDFKDQLRVTQQQTVSPGNIGERTYYVYEAAGQRTRKVTERQNGTRKEERLYLGGFEIYRSYLGDGTTLTLERETLHVMDGTRRIALVETKTIDKDAAPFNPISLIRYQIGNHLGSASLELDETGEIISYEEYYPYGSTSYQAVHSGVEVSPKRYRYIGKERDEGTGFYYLGKRYYIPWLGRWTSGDPAGMVDGPNVYQYSRSCPISYVDPSGTEGELPKAEPIREGMFIGDYPGLSSRWKQATDETLKRVFGGGTYKENLARFQKEIETRPRGSNREKGSAINFARRVFNAVNAKFGRLVTLPAATQVHHALQEGGLAENPGEALNPSHLEIANGQAAVATSTHWRAHEAKRLANAKANNPGAEATRRMEAARQAQAGAEAARREAFFGPPKQGEFAKVTGNPEQVMRMQVATAIPVTIGVAAVGTAATAPIMAGALTVPAAGAVAGAGVATTGGVAAAGEFVSLSYRSAPVLLRIAAPAATAAAPILYRFAPAISSAGDALQKFGPMLGEALAEHEQALEETGKQGLKYLQGKH